MLDMYIDGDALPNILKPILLRSIERLGIKTFVVVNKKINKIAAKYIEYIIVDAGADEADDKIAELLKEGDLVITADIPLADRVITKTAHAIDHRGELYSVDNIKQYLAMRNLMATIRESGEMTGGPKAFSQKDAQMFANQLNSFLIKHYK